MKFTPDSLLYRYAKLSGNKDDAPFKDACSLLSGALTTTTILGLILFFFFALETCMVLLGANVLNKIGVSPHETLIGSLVMAHMVGTILTAICLWTVYRIHKKLETVPCELPRDSWLVSFATLTNSGAKTSKTNWSDFIINIFASFIYVGFCILMTFMISVLIVGMLMEILNYSKFEQLSATQVLAYGFSGQVLAALIFGVGYLICKSSTVEDSEAV